MECPNCKSKGLRLTDIIKIEGKNYCIECYDEAFNEEEVSNGS